MDLDRDGWLDVLTFDVDFDFVGCSRRAHVYHNLGGSPGDNVTLQEQTTGSGCQNFLNNPPTCLVASIPASQLTGTYDIAAFDINGDGWDDLVIGTCSGTEVWLNQPQGIPAGATPDGDNVTGTQLTLGKSGSEISLAWGASCAPEDSDYAVYAGSLGSDFSDHEAVACSTGGATALSFEPGAAGEYYLVVPRNAVFEGSYGSASNGVPRQPGSPICAQQLMGFCQ